MSAYDRAWITISLNRFRIALQHRQQECQSHSATIAEQQEELCTGMQFTPQSSLSQILAYLKALANHCNIRTARLERHGWHGHEVDLPALIAANATAVCGLETASWYVKRTLAKTARALWTCQETITAEEASFSDVIDKLMEISEEVLVQETSEHLTLRNFHVGQVEELLAARCKSGDNFPVRVQSLNDMSMKSHFYVGNHDRTVHEFMLIVSELGVMLPRQSLITDYFE